jgi:hypothetical protein
MNKNLQRFAWLIMASLAGMSRSSSIELKGAPRVPAPSQSSVSSESGTVTRIDASSIVLDGKRRFAFSPATVMVRNQNNQAGSGRLAEVREGTKVSLTVVRNAVSASPRVSELWIAP